ncbi:hypothetical protein EVA_12620 [gut metagenome]|uniref:Uncharacterized protein n=1 Tax=gut metagenome TaxID=749906 RepID=J9GBY4_9ZZZZ
MLYMAGRFMRTRFLLPLISIITVLWSVPRSSISSAAYWVSWRL